MAAANALSGRNVWLGIGKQTAVNVPAAPTKFFEVTALGGILEEYETKKSDRRVRSRFKPSGFKTGKKVPLSFTVEANPQNAGLVLALALGSDTVAAAGAAFEHSIRIAEALPYFTAVVYTAGVADSVAGDKLHQIVNCKVVSLKIDGTVDDVLKISIDAQGTRRSPGLASIAGVSVTLTSGNDLVLVPSSAGLFPGMSVSGTGIPAGAKILTVPDATQVQLSAPATASGAQALAFAFIPAFPVAKAFFLKAEEGQAKIDIGVALAGAAQFDEGNEFHFSISNGITADKRIDNTAEATALREGDSEITGSMKVIFNRNTMAEVEQFQAGTMRAIRFTDTSEEEAAVGRPYLLALDLDRTKYSGAPASWDPDVIGADLQFEVEHSATGPVIRLVNIDAQAY